MTEKEPLPEIEQNIEGVSARIACVRQARVSCDAILLAVSATGKDGDVVEITMATVWRDLDPELVTFSSRHAAVRLCSASVVGVGARRPLLPDFVLPAELPVCETTTHTAIESLRAGEQIVWELAFVTGGQCDINIYCPDGACR